MFESVTRDDGFGRVPRAAGTLLMVIALALGLCGAWFVTAQALQGAGPGRTVSAPRR